MTSRMCQTSSVLERGVHWRVRPRTGGAGTGRGRMRVRWPCGCTVLAGGEGVEWELGCTFPLQRINVTVEPTQFRTSVANRAGSGSSYSIVSFGGEIRTKALGFVQCDDH